MIYGGDIWNDLLSTISGCIQWGIWMFGAWWLCRAAPGHFHLCRWSAWWQLEGNIPGAHPRADTSGRSSIALSPAVRHETFRKCGDAKFHAMSVLDSLWCTCFWRFHHCERDTWSTNFGGKCWFFDGMALTIQGQLWRKPPNSCP